MDPWAKLELPGAGPRYRALADAIERMIAQGRLAADEKLPTHRSLAAALGLAIGTVTRAYAEAERRGLVSGEVGRGTFVRSRRATPAAWGEGAGGSGALDLSLALPWTLPDDEEGRLLGRTLAAIGAETGLTELLRYQPATALERHRVPAAAWLAGAGVPAEAARVLVTAGAQHAMTVALAVLAAPGEEVLTEALTYPGLISVARVLGRPLRGVALDAEGMAPEALDRTARESRARWVYVVPTAQNPTGGTMSSVRREEIVAVARAHDLGIIEDEVHARLLPDPLPPLAALAPERTIHLATFSKSVAFGLRTAFVSAPARYVDRLTAGVRSTLWMAAPLMAEVTVRWLEDGTAAGIIHRKREEVAARQAMLRELLAPYGRLWAAPYAIHGWLHLPEPWRAEAFVEEARRRNVILAGAAAFAVGRAATPHAVRICVGTPPDRETLRAGLEAVAAILEGGVPPTAQIV